MRPTRLIELFSVLIISALFLSTIPLAVASTQIDMGAVYYLNSGTQEITGFYSNTVNRPQSRVLQHSTGKICILTYDTNLITRIRVLSSTGSILASQIIPGYSGSGNTDGGVTLAEYSATQIIIAYGTTDAKVHFYIFNINTYSGTDYVTSTLPTISGAGAIDRMGQLYYYNGLWYIFTIYSSWGGGTQAIWCKFTVATLTASYFTQFSYTHAPYTSEVMGFQDPNNLGMVYFITSKNGAGANDYTTPEYYKFNCATGATTLLATNGVSGRLPQASSNTLTQPYSNMINYMGGGIHQDLSGIYLWQSWEYSYSSNPSGLGVRHVEVNHWTAKFTGSISAGTLDSQVMKTYDASDLSLTTAGTPGISWGYTFTAYNSSTQALYAYYQDNYGMVNKVLSKVTLNIPDVTTMSSSFNSIQVLTKVDNQDFSMYNVNSCNVNMMHDNIHGITYIESQTAVHGYIFLGEPITGITYTVTASYTPVDNPLKTGVHYTFKWDIYANGLLDNYNDTYKVFVDGLENSAGVIANGIVTLPVTVQSIGIHSLYVSVYHNNVFEYSSPSISYPWVSPTGGGGSNPTGTIMTGWFNLATVWVPIFGFVIVPMFALAFIGGKYAGGTGMVIGMLGGGFAGVVGGTQLLILPSYILYFYILFMGVALTLSIMMGRGGGGG
jgi:hypothetical protein